MRTLHELAVKLQTFIVEAQEDAHNVTNMSITKYNNLKLKMDTKLNYPNIIVSIGISEGLYNFVEGTKVDGGLGPDEKYIRKWLGSSTVISDLKEIWYATSELINANDQQSTVETEGQADDATSSGPTFKKSKNKDQEDDVSIEEFLDFDKEYQQENDNSKIE